MTEKLTPLTLYNLTFQEILDAEPELDALDPSLICPVCLDLLHEPFAAVPCKHIFCEPCLRRLASKNPMNTLCPMCRQRIAYCEHKQGTCFSYQNIVRNFIF